MNHERNKAQAAYLSVMERALSHEGAPFSIEKGSFRNLLTGGALFLMRARPSSIKKGSSIAKGSSRIDQAKVRHSFALEMNVGAGTQFVHR